MRVRLSLPAAIVSVIVIVSGALAEEWPRFRGPNGAGVSEATTIPVSWTEDDYRWKIELPGIGYSSPVGGDGQVFITSGDEETGRVTLQCLRAGDGSEIWSREFAVTPYKKHKHNSYAAATPTIDKEKVYLSVGGAERVSLVALTRDSGEQVWQYDFGPYESSHGFCSSPVLFDRMVLVTNEQVGQSSIAALDADSGELRWRTPTETEIASYSTPCIYRPETGKPQLIVTSSEGSIRGLDPWSGEEVWNLPLLENRVVGSPIVAAGLVFASAGKGGAGREMHAVRPGNPATGAEPEVAYSFEGRMPYVPTSVAKGDLLFTWFDKGMARCFHAPTGKLIWEETVKGSFYTSPIRVADRLYTITMDGEMIVLAADDQFAELARFDLGEPSFATPAVIDGVMYLRTHGHLMAIGGE